MKPIIKLILLTLFVITYSSCSKNTFIGEWRLLSKQYDVYWNFTDDSLIISNSHSTFRHSYTLQDSVINCASRTAFYYKAEGNDYVIWNYKPYNGNALDKSNPLDEVTYITKDKEKNIKNVRDEKMKVVELIVDGIGDYYIDIKTEGIHKNSTVNDLIPDKLIKTNAVITPKEYILNQYTFTDNVKGLPISYFYTPKEIADSIPRDRVMIKVYGINQMGTKTIEKHFKQKVEGDVLMFRVDTLTNLLTTFKSPDIF